MKQTNNSLKSIDHINKRFPKDKIKKEDIKYHNILHNDLIPDLVIFPIFFSVTFLLFALLGLFAFSPKIFIPEILIVITFLSFGTIIIYIIAKRFIIRPQIYITKNKLYFIKDNSIERYRINTIIKDIFISKDYITLKYKPSFTEFEYITINTKGIDQKEILSSLFDKEIIKELLNNKQENFNLRSLVNTSLSSIVVTTLIGFSWTIFGAIFTFGSGINIIEQGFFQPNNYILLILGFVFFIMGLYLVYKFGFIDVLKTKAIYLFKNNGVVISTNNSRRYLGYDQIRSISSMKKIFGLYYFRITASYIKYRMMSIGPDHLYIYSKEDITNIRRFLKSLK